MRNECNAPVSGIYRLGDTKCHHLLKQDNGHIFSRDSKGISATNIFRSLDMLIASISLSFGSIAIHNQIYSEPALIAVSSIINSEMFFFLLDAFGLYFCIHFQMETWLMSTLCKKDNAFAVFLNDKPRKYKYNP